ncbi:hypothetical protein ABZT51_18605 [Streptomyces sp. NPDC005373]|uniref:hypothetical protein n=1 Tax=Streptomyces sp. NPDC005373 TaxID=3156879 RepID=UPI0033A92DEC
MPETTSAPEGTTLTAPEPSRSKHPFTLWTIGVWLAVLAVLAGFGVASAAAAEGDAARPGANVSLVGVWDLTVTVHTPDGGTSVTTPRFTFNPDHKLSAQGPPDSTGAPLYVAKGYWNQKADGTISFYITHQGASEGGAIPGTVEAVHLGRITGKTFNTVAYAFVTETPGAAPIGPIDVGSTATWVSSAPTA